MNCACARATATRVGCAKGSFLRRYWLTSPFDWRWIQVSVRWWVLGAGPRAPRTCGVCHENAELERRFAFDCNLNKTSYG